MASNEFLDAMDTGSENSQGESSDQSSLSQPGVAPSVAVKQELSSPGSEFAASMPECCSLGDSEERIPDNVYEFETVEQALAGNKDWLALAQTAAMLHAGRAQAIRDRDRLLEAQQLLRKDPEAFVERLRRGTLSLPQSCRTVPELPDIDWDKYTSGINLVPANRREAKLLHRLMTGREEDEKMEQGGSESEGEVKMVRGRVKDETKPSTFNKLWTHEEQAKLEALLIKYPSEPVEIRRFKKIAAELGNRTVAQVASRVQKYFIKLAKNSLPIPGRPPSMALTKKAGHRSRSYHQYVQHESTFLQSYQPVNLPDDDFDEDCTAIRCKPAEDDPMAVSDEEDVPEYQRNSELYKEILKLKQFKRMLQVRHIGYACDNCRCEPIVGTRWHCMDCPPDTSVDLCENCSDSTFELDSHNSSHRLRPLRRVQDSTADVEYQAITRMDNYLDPNFVPFS